MQPLISGTSPIKLLSLIKAAPFRSVLAFILLLPILLFSLAFAFIFAAYLFEFILTFLFYGLAGLASERPHDIVFSYVSWPAKLCWNVMTFMTFGDGLRLFLMFPYFFAAIWLLGSAARDLRNKQPDKAQVFSTESNERSHPTETSSLPCTGIVDTTSPTWSEVMAEVKRRTDECRSDDPRSWEEILSDGRERWEKIKSNS